MRFDYCRTMLPDELLYFYIMDLVHKNKLGSFSEFERRTGCRLLTNQCYGLSDLKLNIKNQVFPSVPEMIKHTSIGCDIYDLPKGEQMDILESSIYSMQAPFVHISTKRGVRSYWYICPDCWEEDKEKYGEGYVHLSHNLPNVHACYKHSKPLILVNVPEKRNLLLSKDSFSLLDGEELDLIDFTHEVIAAEGLDERNEIGLSNLHTVKCNRCGFEYPEIKGIGDMAAGCPVCTKKFTSKELIQKRLDVRYSGDYEVVNDAQRLAGMKVVHKPCGTIRRDTRQLLYGMPVKCNGCLKIDARSLQRRYDPEETTWKFLPLGEMDVDSKRKIKVKHLACGNEFTTYSHLWSAEQRCPYCNSRVNRKEISKEDSEYELVGDYINNHTKIEILHKSCGTTFKMTKTSFLAGGRCPLCTPRYTYEGVECAIKDCASKYEVRRSSKTGNVVVKFPDGKQKRLEFNAVMTDLKRSDSKILVERDKQYVEEVSVRRKVFDEISKVCNTKGYWSPKDGLFGEKVTENDRSMIQKLKYHGYIKSSGYGKYITVKYEK